MPCVLKNALQYYGFTDWQMQNIRVTDWLNSRLTNDHSANLPFSCSHGHEMGKKLVLQQSIATFFLECIAILWLFLVQHWYYLYTGKAKVLRNYLTERCQSVGYRTFTIELQLPQPRAVLLFSPTTKIFFEGVSATIGLC